MKRKFFSVCLVVMLFAGLTTMTSFAADPPSEIKSKGRLIVNSGEVVFDASDLVYLESVERAQDAKLEEIRALLAECEEICK